MPLLLNDWYIAHPPKTGGSTVLAAVMNAGGRRLGGGHDLHVHHRRDIAANRWRICSTIRDPWTRYGSLYGHALRIGVEHRLEAWGNGAHDFRSVLYGWTHPRQVRRFPRELGVIWSPGRGDRFLASGLGFYSWELEQLTDGACVGWMACDRLAEALPDLLGCPMTIHKDHGSGRPDYRDWYTDDMVEWVAEAEAPLIRRFGWEPWEPSPRAVWR